MAAAMHVLVVEDSAAMARVLRRNLEAAGFTVTLASNGHQAWQILSKVSVDIVVTDYAMPYMDGGRLCGKMRSDHRYINTPVILLTGRGFEIDTDGLKESMRIAEVFYKPFSAVELVRSVMASAETIERERSTNRLQNYPPVDPAPAASPFPTPHS